MESVVGFVALAAVNYRVGRSWCLYWDWNHGKQNRASARQELMNTLKLKCFTGRSN